MSHSLAVFTPLWLEAQAVRPALPDAEIVRCGVGPRRAKDSASQFAQRVTRPRAIAVAGVCGSLDSRYAPGDVIVASEIRGAGAPRLLDSAKSLARALEAQGTPVHLGPILSIDHGAKHAERESLRATGAIAVDMESAWLASLADSHLFAILRVVSDNPDHELFSWRIVANGLRALRSLRAAAPALATWASH